jgi:RND family efflux transporter MFP subunit
MAAFLLALLNQACPAQVVEGFTEPYRQIGVAAAADGGLITAINVKEGELVSKGQILAELNSEVLEATLKVAQERSRLRGKKDAATAELTLRERRLEKLKELVTKRHATEAEVERAEADLEIAKANLVLAQEEQRVYALECLRIEAELERRRIKSPIHGVVVELHREVGESVMISDPRVLTLVQLNPLRVRLSMSYAQTTNLQVGQEIPLSIVEAGKSTKGKIEVISPVMDAKSGTVQVTCVIDNGKRAFYSGQRCIFSPDGTSNANPLAVR